MKPIKKTVDMNLHELIKFIWDNDITGEYIKLKGKDARVVVDAYGRLQRIAGIDKHDLFEVQVEERINKSTVLDEIIFILKYPNGKRRLVRKFGISVNDVLDMNSLVVEIHALIDGDADYILVWEAD